MRAIQHAALDGHIRLSGVQVVPAHLAEKYLPQHAEATLGNGPGPRFDQSGDHIELWTKTRTEYGAAERVRKPRSCVGPVAGERRRPELHRVIVGIGRD